MDMLSFELSGTVTMIYVRSLRRLLDGTASAADRDNVVTLADYMEQTYKEPLRREP